jgi:hypothetical protein
MQKKEVIALFEQYTSIFLPNPGSPNSEVMLLTIAKFDLKMYYYVLFACHSGRAV